MIKGKRIHLRPVRDEDWSLFEEWGKTREALWGPFQRFQMDHLPLLRQAYGQTGLLTREACGKGLAKEAVGLLVVYLFSGYAVERLSSFTDMQNKPAQKLLEALGFQREGILRRVSFRDGAWRVIAIYGLLRDEWKGGYISGSETIA